MKRTPRCHHCQEIYKPNPRTYRAQKYCRKPECQSERKRLNWQKWLIKNPDYDTSVERQTKQKQARQTRRTRDPNYWKKYRKNHPASTTRNRRLQTRRNAQSRGLIANPTGLNEIYDDKLARIAALSLIANPTGLIRIEQLQIDGIVRFLRWSKRIANPTTIAQTYPAVRK